MAQKVVLGVQVLTVQEGEVVQEVLVAQEGVLELPLQERWA